MPTLEDYQAHLAKNPRAAAKSIERSIVNGVAVAMSELKGDPNWKLYCDHIEALRLTAEAQVKQLERAICYGPFPGELDRFDYTELKRQLAVSKTRFEIYTQVIAMVDGLINRGGIDGSK